MRYENNIDAGEATVKAFGLGNYARVDVDGKEAPIATANFNIIGLGTIANGDITSVTDVEYAGGLYVEPQVTVKVGGKTLTQGVDYTVKTKIIEVDKYKNGEVTITGKGAYNTTDNKPLVNTAYTWSVVKKDLKNTDITVKDGKVTVMNGTVVVPEAEYEVKENENGSITVSAKADSKNYTGSQDIEGEITVPVISASVERNQINVTVDKTVDGATAYDYVLCKNEEDLSALDFFKANKSVDAASSDFQFVRSGSYNVYARAITRDADGKKSYSDWSKAADVTITTDTPNAATINKVTVSGNKVTVTFTPGARTEGVDVMLGQTLRSSNGEPQRPVTSNFAKYLQKNLNAAYGKKQTVTFTNVAKGTHYIGVHPYITSNDGLKYFGRWSKQSTATKVVVK